MDYNEHWDEKFKSRPWGKYPPEDLVSFIFRKFINKGISNISILEVGCGTGANLWFLQREGLKVAGIDSSQEGIRLAKKRLRNENFNLKLSKPSLKVGNFQNLPWDDKSFEVVIDIFAIYANDFLTITNTISEINRVLKKGGYFYTKLWGKKTSGYGTGTIIEDGTYMDIKKGPCQDMGIAHFFDKKEILNIFKKFEICSINEINKNDGKIKIQEFHCLLKKI